jgi:hypothetical protein
MHSRTSNLHSKRIRRDLTYENWRAVIEDPSNWFPPQNVNGCTVLNEFMARVLQDMTRVLATATLKSKKLLSYAKEKGSSVFKINRGSHRGSFQLAFA